MSFLKRFLGSSSKPKRSSRSPYDLENPLIYFSKNDPWRIKDACEGTQIFGATGSGKTSGSGQAIAKSFLQSGFGGLVLTAKPDERTLWEKYARETGRSDSLIVFSSANKWRFNFLDYELRRPGLGAGMTENLVTLFCTVLEIAERKQGASGGESYWQRTLKQLLRNAIDLVTIANGTVSLPELYEVITSAPQSAGEVRSEAWQNNSLCFSYITAGEGKAKGTARQNDFDLTARYWLNEFPNLADRTRSIIVSTFTSMADCFLRGTLRELFCTTTNVVPELSFEGAVIILDLPIKEFSELGQFAQVLFKLIWQRAVERRNVIEKPRPVFLWADESQYFVSSYDIQFQTTARSSKACTVYLTQNLPNYYAMLGGERAKAETDSLMGNFQTKIFHANGDHITNTWAADLFSKTMQFKANASASSPNAMQDPFNPEGSTSSGGSQALEWEVLPHEFTTLRKGGHENGLCVDSVIFQGGRIWRATDKNHIKTTFSQNG